MKNLSSITNNKDVVTKEYADAKQDIIQYSTMPTASASTVAKIVQYTGTTDTTYTKGYFYIGTESSGTYSWTQLNVQPGGSGGSGYGSYVIDRSTVGSQTNPFVLSEHPLGTYFIYTPVGTSSGYFYIRLTPTGRSFSMQTALGNLSSNMIGVFDYIYDANNIDANTPTGTVLLKTYLKGYKAINNTPYLVDYYIQYSTSELSNLATYEMASLDYKGVTTNTTQTISGVKTFSALPKTTVAPTSNDQLANKKYVDDSISGQSTVLYNNTEGGINTDVTLSASAANYSYLEIYYRMVDDVTYQNSTKIYDPNGKIASLTYISTNANGTMAYIRNRNVLISGTSITTSGTRNSLVGLASGAVALATNNDIYIIRVVGYK